jgi:hypothetical protein
MFNKTIEKRITKRLSNFDKKLNISSQYSNSIERQNNVLEKKKIGNVIQYIFKTNCSICNLIENKKKKKI